MNITGKHAAIIFAVLLLLGAAAVADTAMVQFNQAYIYLNTALYEKAYDLFASLYSNYPDHAKADQFLFFKGKAAYYNGEYETAISDFVSLIDKFKYSEYISSAYLFRANASFRLGNADDAFKDYLRAYRYSDNNSSNEIIIRSLKSSLKSVSPQARSYLNRAKLDDDKRCRLANAIGDILFEIHEYQLLVSNLEGCKGSQAKYLFGRANDLLRQNTEIAVVLPLSGDLKKYGDMILDGAMLRFEEFRSKTGRNINPVLYDTKGDDLEAARIVKMLSESSTSAAIGPLTSEASAVSSATLTCSDLPLIIPAAGEGGLTELSQTAFQLQANIDLQGIKMAEFAYKYIGADTAAIFTPTASENLRIASAFKDRFEQLGGEILGVEYFRVRDTDFGPYVRDLKEIIIGDLLDSIIFIDNEGDTIEAEEVPVDIDCLFIPATANQLRQLLPQIHFYNLNTVFLGSDGWGNEVVYRLGKRITKECYFASGLIEDYQSELVSEFARLFDRWHGRQPGRMEKLGYDAAALLCEAIEAGSISRSEIKKYLENINQFEGTAGKVTFGDKRENIILPIYTIEDGVPKRVESDHRAAPESEK